MEFVRHRVFSFSQESTRYCNYSKDKFGNELTFIIPSWLDIKEGSYHTTAHLTNGINQSTAGRLWFNQMSAVEDAYMTLLTEGWKPQQARAVLPNSLKTTLVMTGTIEQWEGFFKLRCDKDHAHPDAYYLASKLKDEFLERGYITIQ